jgi:hypothetical protein
MTKPNNTSIKSYDDLLRHKQETEMLLHAQKELMMYDLRLLQAEFKAATSSLAIVGKLVSRNKKNVLVNMGVNKVLDFVLKKVILARAGWFTKLGVTFLAKNLSSHYIDENKDKLVDKLFGWVSHKNGNGKATHESFGHEANP